MQTEKRPVANERLNNRFSDEWWKQALCFWWIQNGVSRGTYIAVILRQKSVAKIITAPPTSCQCVVAVVECRLDCRLARPYAAAAAKSTAEPGVASWAARAWAG